ncbi:MAG: undecaprenyldiphospho-muramoylpentapeptide beta-N-acetylglucosaminyltransferase [Treponema sp.]|nr:undecaprenyldiphospho-muramoylpentapeptide beta-N-acetylglucosaminyltransferase [Treponema sp.]
MYIKNIAEKSGIVYPLTMLNIAFTGGGTGGHIYPGLAVVSYIKKRSDCRIFWIGNESGMDRSIVEGAGLKFYGIPAGKLRRNFSLKNLSDLFRVLAGFLAARRILKKERPAALFSKGGFVSVPPCAAAASLGITVFTHESDYSPGLATGLNARFACRGRGGLITAYAETAARFPSKYRERVFVLGNPVRSEFRNGDAAAGRAFLGASGSDRILLVLGGSQGAREINGLIRECLEDLCRDYLVIHQTGPAADWDPPPSPRYRSYPYIKDEMSAVLAAAELVAGRSGAGTVWECATAGKPMVLIPLAGSGTRGDQLENAGFFEKAGAALVIGPGPERNGKTLAGMIAALAADHRRREAMAAAAAEIGAADGTARIAEKILNTVNAVKEE